MLSKDDKPKHQFRYINATPLPEVTPEILAEMEKLAGELASEVENLEKAFDAVLEEERRKVTDTRFQRK